MSKGNFTYFTYSASGWYLLSKIFQLETTDGIFSNLFLLSSNHLFLLYNKSQFLKALLPLWSWAHCIWMISVLNFFRVPISVAPGPDIDTASQEFLLYHIQSLCNFYEFSISVYTFHNIALISQLERSSNVDMITQKEGFTDNEQTFVMCSCIAKPSLLESSADVARKLLYAF